MALSSAITTSRLTQAYQQSPFERISARIYDFSSFFSAWIGIGSIKIARTSLDRENEFASENSFVIREVGGIRIRHDEVVQNSSKFQIFNDALIILYYCSAEKL